MIPFFFRYGILKTITLKLKKYYFAKLFGFLHFSNIYVTVGSHSGKIVCIDAISGITQGTLQVKSRIEAPVLCYNDTLSTPYGAVGTYDGTIVCFTLENCEQIWKINIGSMIKSKGVFCKGRIYIASYDGFIRCIDASVNPISY